MQKEKKEKRRQAKTRRFWRGNDPDIYYETTSRAFGTFRSSMEQNEPTDYMRMRPKSQEIRAKRAETILNGTNDKYWEREGRREEKQARQLRVRAFNQREYLFKKLRKLKKMPSHCWLEKKKFSEENK